MGLGGGGIMTHKEQAEECAWFAHHYNESPIRGMFLGDIEREIRKIRRHWREHLKRKTATEATKPHKESEK